MTRSPLRPGDPVGCGEVYLPTRAAAEAYQAACRDAILTADARAIIAIPSVGTRCARVAMYPALWRGALKQKIKELWAAR